MPQTNHGSIEFLKFPDPQYPGDTTRMIKKWLRDSWARRKIVALQQAIGQITEKTGADVITKSTAFANADVTSVHGKVQGNICQIDAMIGSGTYSAGANTVGTLAAPFRPSGSTCYGIAFLGGGSATGTVARVAITTSGILTIYAPSSVSTTARFSMVYAATL